MFGYRIENGEIGIDPDQAEIVRMIFDDYISGMGCPTIAKKLRKMGMARPRGGTWNSERVAEIIKNEKYAGNALLQKKHVEDHLSKTTPLTAGAAVKKRVAAYARVSTDNDEQQYLSLIFWGKVGIFDFVIFLHQNPFL